MSQDPYGRIVVVDHLGIVHDPATWTHGGDEGPVSVEKADGRDVDCMTCLVIRARSGARGEQRKP